MLGQQPLVLRGAGVDDLDQPNVPETSLQRLALLKSEVKTALAPLSREAAVDKG
jgi:hypothetical protein